MPNRKTAQQLQTVHFFDLSTGRPESMLFGIAYVLEDLGNSP